MHIPKKYFHDRLVLLLLSVNSFLTLLGMLLIMLKIDFGVSDGYIVQYRSDQGLDAFKSGDATAIISFVVFLLAVLVYHTVLSMRMYHKRHQFSLVVLVMGALLLTVAVVVSNALLGV